MGCRDELVVEKVVGVKIALGLFESSFLLRAVSSGLALKNSACAEGALDRSALERYFNAWAAPAGSKVIGFA